MGLFEGCKHEKDWEFMCDPCGDNFCDKCFGKNMCLNCEFEEDN